VWSNFKLLSTLKNLLARCMPSMFFGSLSRTAMLGRMYMEGRSARVPSTASVLNEYSRHGRDFRRPAVAAGDETRCYRHRWQFAASTRGTSTCVSSRWSAQMRRVQTITTEDEYNCGWCYGAGENSSCSEISTAVPNWLVQPSAPSASSRTAAVAVRTKDGGNEAAGLVRTLTQRWSREVCLGKDLVPQRECCRRRQLQCITGSGVSFTAGTGGR
jgi:hypothetical protein